MMKLHCEPKPWLISGMSYSHRYSRSSERCSNLGAVLIYQHGKLAPPAIPVAEVDYDMGSTTSHSDNNEFHPAPALERIIFFSDAVIAIAVTLLAIDVRPPEVELSRLPLELMSLTPD